MAQTSISFDLNMVELLRKGLADEVKKTVTEKIIANELKGFEVKIRPHVKSLVDGVSFKGIQHLKDLMHLRDELHVFIHWDDEDKPRSQEV